MCVAAVNVFHICVEKTQFADLKGNGGTVRMPF
jgi:hypothetical protein